MNLLRFMNYALQHPLAGRAPFRAVGNVLGWQIKSRLSPGPHSHRWIGDSCLIVWRSMTGATGNIYYGLHEFFDMAFLLHFLRQGDVFGDVGANVGSYTILAAKICNAEVIGFEPDPSTAIHYRRNVEANCVGDRVTLIEAAVGDHEGALNFTVGLDTTNHVLKEGEDATRARNVPMTTLDIAFAERRPILLKIDVEGFEDEVIGGAAATLADPVVRCIEIETVSGDVLASLSRYGFEPYDYDPFVRRLVRSEGARKGHNQLFVRDLSFVEARVRDARAFVAMGQRI